MINTGNLGRLSGDPVQDGVGQSELIQSEATPMLLNVSSVPEAGYHLTLTNPIVYGYIDFNGWLWTPPSNDGDAGTVLTTDGTGVTTWEPAVHTISFGTTGLSPSAVSSNAVVVDGVLNIAHGGTGGVTAKSAMENLLPDQSGHAGECLATDGAGNLSWLPAAGAGTVTSVDVLGGTTGLTTSGGPVIGAGTITLGGVLNIANGGTGLSTIGANGTVLTSNGTTASWAALPAGMVYPAAGVAVSTGSAWGASITLGTGVSAALSSAVNAASGLVTYSGALGTPQSGNFSTGTFTWPTFNQNTTGTAANVSGVVAVANGGTGQTTASSALNALLPSQATHSGEYLTTDGAGNVSWGAVASGGVASFSGGTTGLLPSSATTGPIVLSGTLDISNGGTGQTSATAALNALLPSQSGANTWVLTSDGTNSTFEELVSGATAGNIPVETATGSLADSGKYFSDTTTSNSNIWSANQTQSMITTGLLNTPTLPAVNAATTANITLANTQTIDGVALAAGNYVLVKNQTTLSQNGIYRVVAGVAPGGNWIRQAYSGGTYVDVTTETTYGDLNINNGVMNVIAGTVSRNLQYQLYIQSPATTLAAGTPVYATSVIKTPTPSLWNRFVDPQNGNDTNNNGSSALPFATLTKALVGLSYPSTVTEASGGIDASSITWTSGMPNCVVQGQNIANDGGQSVMSGVMTFATGSTRNDFVNISFSNATPFVFQSGAAMRNYFQGITLTGTVGANWLGLNAGISNWITLDNIDFSNFLATSVVLPSFTNAFTFNLQNQTRSILRFTGTGAANTQINLQNCLDGYVWIPPTYLGNINWFGLGFDSELGSVAFADGVIKTASDLATVLGWTADSTYDGWYAINVNSPSSFALGAIFGKTTILGTTHVYWGRTFAHAPSAVYTKAGNLYGKALTGWGVINVAAPVVG